MLRLFFGVFQLQLSALLSHSLMDTGVRSSPLTSFRPRFVLCNPMIDVLELLTAFQRDYFGAHTFRVLPGKENEIRKAGEDIRMYSFPFIEYISTDFPSQSHRH